MPGGVRRSSRAVGMRSVAHQRGADAKRHKFAYGRTRNVSRLLTHVRESYTDVLALGWKTRRPTSLWRLLIANAREHQSEAARAERERELLRFDTNRQ